jgi:TolB protein
MKKTGVLFFTFLMFIVSSGFSQAQDSTVSPGLIAYIGTDYNVYTLAQGEAPIALTQDAGITDTTKQIYQWPTWSNEGQLAYFRSGIDTSGSPVTEAFVSPDAKTPGASAYVGTGEAFTYANWSPKSCGTDCRDLALLLSDPSGLSVKLVRWQNGAGTSTTVGTGAPFYYTWSPEGIRMIMQHSNQQFEIYDASASKFTSTLTQIPGAMFTPGWSPIDDRLLLGVKNQHSTDLVIVVDGSVTTLAAGQPNPIWFSWSPDGKQVAYIDRQGPVMVLNAASGAIVSKSPVDNVLAFFWSPDSQQIAYITPPLNASGGSFAAAKRAATSIRQSTTDGIAWSVLDVASGANRQYAAFQPSDELLYLLVYFDQFAVSHRVWSPDSRELVYSEVTPERHHIITILDTTQAASVPLIVGDGVIGIWSFS